MNKIYITIELDGVKMERAVAVEDNGSEVNHLYDVAGSMGEMTLSQLVYDAQAEIEKNAEENHKSDVYDLNTHN